MIVEALLRPTAAKNGGLGVYSPRSVAELHEGLEVWLPGKHERRGLHLGGSVCHWIRNPGSLVCKHLNFIKASASLYFNGLLFLQGILLEHREKEFGNKVETADVLEAVKRIVPLK